MFFSMSYLICVVIVIFTINIIIGIIIMQFANNITKHTFTSQCSPDSPFCQS